MNKVSIFVPLTKADAQMVVEFLVASFTKEFGGASVYELAGSYLREDNGLIDSERVARVDVLVSNADEAVLVAKQRGAQVKAKLDEECVLVEVAPVNAMFV